MTANGAGYLFTFQDVTELKRLEREAETQKRLAAVGQMAAGIAHEIRNPLASMSGSMQVLRQELELEPDQAQLFDIVLRESDRLNQTIRDFLSYARPSQGQTAAVDMATRDQRTPPGCCATARIAPRPTRSTVPSTAPITLHAVEAQMRQIVWNLATNALRAMPNGGTLRLHVGVNGSPDAAANVGGPAVVLSVSDDGVGIPAEDLDRIFQPFHGGFAKGAGLGLAIVHRIVSDSGRLDRRPLAGRAWHHYRRHPAGATAGGGGRLIAAQGPLGTAGRSRRTAPIRRSRRRRASAPRASWSSTTNDRCASCSPSSSAARATRWWWPRTAARPSTSSSAGRSIC